MEFLSPLENIQPLLGGDLFAAYQNSSVVPTREGCHLGQAGQARCPADRHFSVLPLLRA